MIENKAMQKYRTRLQTLMNSNLALIPVGNPGDKLQQESDNLIKDRDL